MPGEMSNELQGALAAVARAIADSLAVREVWDRVADACRIIAPLDGMGIIQLESGARSAPSQQQGIRRSRRWKTRCFLARDFRPCSGRTPTSFSSSSGTPNVSSIATIRSIA
jgi:hypothetical protein